LKNLGRDNCREIFWKMNLRACRKIMCGWARFGRRDCVCRSGAVHPRRQVGLHHDADEGEIRRRFPAVKIETIATANHWVHAERRKNLCGWYWIFCDRLWPMDAPKQSEVPLEIHDKWSPSF